VPAGKHFAGMHEQSHKDEMRDALRGDFERLRARRGDAALIALSTKPVGVVPEPAAESAPAIVTPPEPPPAVHRGFRPGRLFGRT